MGVKYASIHIFTIEKDKILLEIMKCLQEDITKVKKMQFLNLIKDKKVRDMVGSLPGYLHNEILIIQSELAISIYDESATFESIEDQVKFLSKRIINPILYCTNYDDDIFIIGGYKSGRLISRRTAGEGLEVYNINSQELNTSKFTKHFSLFSKYTTERINSITDIGILENEIEQYLQIPLNINLCDAKNNHEQFKEVSSENGIHIYIINII